jgi:CubicO group peptidase (beta-lactamase class C family)
MMRKMKWLAGGLLLLLAGLSLLLMTTPLGARLRASPAVGAAYAAQMACAGVFVTERDLPQVIAEDILPIDPLLSHARISLDRAKSLVTASLFGLAERTALFRPGLGCTLVGAGGIPALLRQAEGFQPLQGRVRPELWPAGDAAAVSEGPALTSALDAAMAGQQGVEGRALIIVHNGHLVAERYGPGFGPDRRFLGWSMSKSVTAALIGTQIAKGKLALDQPAPVAGWRAETDPRHAITLHQLLTMTSGLQFNETYIPGDDATTMLYERDDMGGFAAELPLLHPPGEDWAYSSGTANILSKILFDSAGGSLASTYALAQTQFFEPAGMTSAIFEPDGSGVPVGSSNLYMTARDWARFGLLYLNDGLLGAQRILPESWTLATRQPAHTKDGKGLAYDLQFWLNSDGEAGHPLRMPHCPGDLYMAEGHNGQYVAIIPSANTVIVRLGWDTGNTFFDADRHFAAILAALKTGE